MRRASNRRRLACFALGVWLLGPANGARAQDATGDTLADDRPPIATTLAPLPARLLERLPPGARRPLEQVDVAERDGSYGPRFVERLGDGDLEIEYTVDPRLDARVRAVLERARVSLGHVILMDPASGEVFSYASTDPESFPATRAYPTASLMKVVTAAALLRNAPAAAGRECRYVGSPWELSVRQLTPPLRGGHVDSFRHAIAISNNQCFARYAVADVGEEALLEEMRTAGLLDSPAAGHAAGRVGPIHSRLSLGHLGSGMAGSFITPLAAARLAATLAEGKLVTPYWIASAHDSAGNPVGLPRRAEPNPIWPATIARRLREALVDVTEEGTARRAFRTRDGRARLGPVRVAGKTGTVTGRDPYGRYQWFVGLAPAEAPRVAIAAVVVNGPGRGHRAAEVAARVLSGIFCTSERCDPARADALEARARIRDAEWVAEITEWKQARVREIEEREQRLAFARAQQTAATHEVRDLDQPPRPVEISRFDFPLRLRRDPVHGKIVLQLDLSEAGEVLDVRIASSDLPDFNDFVAREVRSWRFTPPTRAGLPVRATAHLPIPIHIN